MKVSECLVIFWSTPEGHEESDGLYFYGLFSETISTNSLEKTSSLIWLDVVSEIDIQQIEIKNGCVVVCTVRIVNWPQAADWESCVNKTLQEIVDFGALVSWCGGEDSTWSPEVLIPPFEGGNIYAAYTKLTGILCEAPHLDDEYNCLDDAKLLLLHDASPRKTRNIP